MHHVDYISYSILISGFKFLGFLEYCKAPWTINGRWRYINVCLFINSFNHLFIYFSCFEPAQDFEGFSFLLPSEFEGSTEFTYNLFKIQLQKCLKAIAAPQTLNIASH